MFICPAGADVGIGPYDQDSLQKIPAEDRREFLHLCN